MHRSEKASLRPNTSRIPSDEKTATSGGNTHFGPTWTRVMGPPASRIATCPVSRVRTNFNNCRIGSGFLGTSGSTLTSTMSVVVGFMSQSS
jgi:hypothetical protein